MRTEIPIISSAERVILADIKIRIIMYILAFKTWPPTTMYLIKALPVRSTSVVKSFMILPRYVES